MGLTIKDYNTNEKVEKLVAFTTEVVGHYARFQQAGNKQALRLLDYPQDLIHRHVRECYENGMSAQHTLASLYDCFS